jgi:hopanoid biosynthesis associated radical SAM protein HpnH
VHLDGDRARHDTLVAQGGVYLRAVSAIKTALGSGHRVNINCTVFAEEDAATLAAFFDEVTSWGITGITVAPGFRYPHAPRGDVFLGRQRSQALFRGLLTERRRRHWPLNHSPLYLEFLAGRRDFACSPWGSPTRNVFGWQRPCYLLDEGSASSFDSLLGETDWNRYGSDRHPKCTDCMAHCGYEPTAVIESLAHPLGTLRSMLARPASLQTRNSRARRIAAFCRGQQPSSKL